MTDERLPPKRRVKKRKEFLDIQDNGRKVRSHHMLLAYRPRTSGDSRIGITITTKVHKRATKRNQVKRCVREVFRRTRPKFQRQYDMVLIARNGITELDYWKLRNEFRYLLFKANILKSKKDGNARVRE